MDTHSKWQNAQKAVVLQCVHKKLHLRLRAADTAFIVPVGVGFNISDTSWTWGAVCDFTAGDLQAAFVLTSHLGVAGCLYHTC